MTDAEQFNWALIRAANIPLQVRWYCREHQNGGTDQSALDRSIRYRNAPASGPSGNSLDTFYRLFMVLGMNHCSGGVGPSRFDSLKAVVDWVERAISPNRLVAS